MTKTVAIFIAFNAEKTLKKFYENFPREFVDEIILVDDASKDRTYEIAKQIGIQSYKNEINLGYGGNVKKAIFIALQMGADIIVDIHPDGEYKSSVIPLALKKVESGAEFVLGNRFTHIDKPLKSGMYFWKLIPIVLLNFISKAVLKAAIDDYHQGFRVYTRKMLEKINFENNSNGYLFSFELICQAILNKVKMSQVPVETNYTGKKRGASLKNSITYFLGVFKVIVFFLLAKIGYKIKMFQNPVLNIKDRI